MNIVLADVQSLNINLSESVVESHAETGEFSELINSSLTDNPVDSNQVVENKGLISSSFDLEAIDGVTNPVSWVAYLASANITVTTDSEPATMTISEALKSIPGAENASKDTLAKPVVGALMSGDGKVLPQHRELIAEIPMPVSRRVNQQAEIPVKPLVGSTEKINGRENQQVGLMRGDGRELMQTIDQNSFFQSDKPVETAAGKVLDFQAGQYNQLDSAITRPIGIAPTGALSNLQTNLALPVQLEPLYIARPDSSGEWSRGIGDRVSWMINQKLNTATIRLDPPSLGKLEIHIQVRDEVTNITINVQNANTREMIDNASIRLRDALQESGYQNVNVDVGHDRNQPRSDSQQSAEVTTDTGDSSDGQLEQNSDIGSRTSALFRSDSLVDYFA